MRTTEMMNANPTETKLDPDLVARAIEAAVACAQTCTACADACLGEEMVADLRSCISTDLDCADICTTTANVLSRQTAPHPKTIRALVEACVEACRTCAEECEQHASHHEHCRICAEACRDCEMACSALLKAIG